MRAASILCAVIAGFTVFAHAAASGESAIGILALGLAAVSAFLGSRAASGATSALSAFIAVTALAASAGSGILLPAIAIVAALHGWDASLAASRLHGVSREDRRPIVLRYVASSAILAVVSLGLVCLAIVLRIRLSFGIAMGLALGLILLAAAVAVKARPARILGPNNTTHLDEAQ